MEDKKKTKLNMGEPNFENFRRNISKMKKNSQKFEKARRKAHEITDEELSIHFNL